MNRKDFVTTLGAAGLGLAVAAGSAPLVRAQEESTPAEAVEGVSDPFAERLEMRQALYADFTAALAAELGIGSGDEVDAAIRLAMMSVIDGQVDDGLLTFGQAEAMKTLVATAEVPLGPGFGGAPHGGFVRIRHHRGDDDRLFPGREGDRERFLPDDDGDDSTATDDDAGENEGD
jgi:hypothetical protein